MALQYSYVRCGRFAIRLHTPIQSVHKAVRQNYTVQNTPYDVVDFDIQIIPASGLRRIIKPQVRFICNGNEPFSALPIAQAYPLFEWGLNWAVTQHFHEVLVIHAAVLEKNGKAVILPGLPGAGKSTLCAALTYGDNWRLLSDELTLYDFNTHQVLPNPRPVSLKDRSINLIASNFNVPMTATVRDTLKGSVAHAQPTSESIKLYDQSAPPSHIVFPEFNPSFANDEIKTHRQSLSDCFLQLADNSFNYSMLGEKGFRAVGQLVTQCEVSKVEYGGDFDTIFQYFDGLTDA